MLDELLQEKSLDRVRPLPSPTWSLVSIKYSVYTRDVIRLFVSLHNLSPDMHLTGSCRVLVTLFVPTVTWRLRLSIVWLIFQRDVLGLELLLLFAFGNFFVSVNFSIRLTVSRYVSPDKYIYDFRFGFSFLYGRSIAEAFLQQRRVSHPSLNRLSISSQMLE